MEKLEIEERDAGPRTCSHECINGMRSTPAPLLKISNSIVRMCSVYLCEFVCLKCNSKFCIQLRQFYVPAYKIFFKRLNIFLLVSFSNLLYDDKSFLFIRF